MREYKLYKVSLYKTKNGLMGVQGYINDNSLSERHYDEEVDTGRTTRVGKPIFSGKIFFETDTLPESFIENPEKIYNVKNFYDITVEEDDKAKKTIKSCNLVIETNDIIFGQLSNVRRTKPKDGSTDTKPYVFFSYSIDVALLDQAPNKEDFINFLATRGLTLQQDTYQDKYQFSGFYTLFENQIPTFSPLAYKYQHYQVTIQKKGDKYWINNINPTGVFANNAVNLIANVTEIDADKKVVTLVKEANYETLKEEKASNLPYMASTVELMEEYVKKMTFKIKVNDSINVSIGDEVILPLSEDNFSKIQNSKITVDSLNQDNTEKDNNESNTTQSVEEVAVTKEQNTPKDDNVDFDGEPIVEETKKEEPVSSKVDPADVPF